MSEDLSVQEEEQSFLKHVTSHLSTDWSDEQRDAYLQQVLANWRKRREHSREEQRLMQKYLDTVKQHFKPQSPELYDFQQWPVNKNLLVMLEPGSLDSDIVKQVCRLFHINWTSPVVL
jgi:DNA replication protein DnaC